MIVFKSKFTFFETPEEKVDDGVFPPPPPPRVFRSVELTFYYYKSLADPVAAVVVIDEYSDTLSTETSCPLFCWLNDVDFEEFYNSLGWFESESIWFN